ncbi:hypothetical protein HY78_00525 [Rhizorhabdus wittichii DC-6]|nr:hypothetical protein HY78_00525 [Rhizorhabdus wittichii DC-6]
MPIEPSYGEWLQSDALYATSTDATLAARWPTQAIESEAVSPFAEKVDGEAEGGRQIAFLGPPKDTDVHVVPGRHRNLLGRVVTLMIDRLGYDAGVNCFVIGADEQQVTGSTVLTVLRRR